MLHFKQRKLRQMGLFDTWERLAISLFIGLVLGAFVLLLWLACYMIYLAFQKGNNNDDI